MSIRYVDTMGRLIFVSEGLGGGCYMTMYKKPGKWDSAGSHRLKSKDLPIRDNEAQAQIDLAAYAVKHGWETDDGEPASKVYLRLKGEEPMPKRTYWTKCGRVFEKNSTAAVTGYHIDLNAEENRECVECPFRVEVTEGWGENAKHVRWECRAGSKPPNHKNEWIGSTEDKLSIHIKSLDHNFLEAVMKFCEEHPDLSAGYNQDLDDCRRVISVSCSQNKKGITAKKALIEKFFPETKAKPDEAFEDDKMRTCNAYVCPFNDLEGHCCFADEDPNSDGYQQDVIAAVRDYGCENEDVVLAYKVIEDPDLCDVPGEENESLFDERKCRVCGCTDTNACLGGCYWVEEDLCSKCAEAGVDKPEICNQCENEDTGCIPNNPEGGMCAMFVKEENTALEATGAKDIQTFDYSSVDAETAEFLQEKANRITEIRIKSVVAIGKELAETFDNLSKLGYGEKTKTFDTWVESIGISPRHARRYIDAYRYVIQNLDTIEAAEKIQPSLLFEISKPSAPKELQQAVISGDITTHKEYQEMLKKYQEAEFRAQQAEERAQKEHDKWFREVQTSKSAQARVESLEGQLKILQQQLEQAKRNGSPEKIQELGQRIREYQEQIQEYRAEISKLNTELQEKNKQLKERPIEAAVTKIVEKYPQREIHQTSFKVYGALLTAKSLSDEEIRITAQGDFHRCEAVLEFLEELELRIPTWIQIIEDSRKGGE